MEIITPEMLMELFLDTLNRCGLFLLNEDDEEIGYSIFEEFDIGVISFLHDDSLSRLRNCGFINDEILRKSQELRRMVRELDGSDIWNVNSVRQSQQWFEIMELSDHIKNKICKMSKS